MKKLYTLVALTLLASMLLTACGAPATAGRRPAPTTAPAAARPHPLHRPSRSAK